MTPDRITVRNLALFTNHGVFAAEAELGQRFFLDVTVETDFSEASATDDVSKTVSYADLVKVVSAAFTEERHKLLESLAERIARQIFAAFPRVGAAEITIRKPSAPIAAIFDTVEISIRRSRDG
jgi:7,8-dihydroneopterin aldolase/epimerase/oxygenase